MSAARSVPPPVEPDLDGFDAVGKVIVTGEWDL
jgi:hypothetical protein